MALGVAIAIRPVTRGHTYRARKFQLSFSADDRIIDLGSVNADIVVDA